MHGKTLGLLVLGAVLVPGAAFADVDLSNGGLGALNQSGGTILFNTDNGTYSLNGGPAMSGGTLIAQPGTVGISAFDFTSISLTGVMVTATGSNSLAILGTLAVTFNGDTINLAGGSGLPSGVGGNAGVGGGGGGGGGEGAQVGTFNAGGTGGLGDGGFARLGNNPAAPNGANGIKPGFGASANGDGGNGGGGAGPSPSFATNGPGGGGGGGGNGGGAGGAWGNNQGSGGGDLIGSGGGGGYAAPGTAGSRVNASQTTPGGGIYGSANLAILQGGSGGGGGADDSDTSVTRNGGGGGGGALEITSRVSLVFTNSQIDVNGGNGAGGAIWAAGGGGSGGAFKFGAPTVSSMGTTYDALGGLGGGANNSAGGNGGEGYLALYTNQLTDLGGNSLEGSTSSNPFPTTSTTPEPSYLPLNVVLLLGLFAIRRFTSR